MRRWVVDHAGGVWPKEEEREHGFPIANVVATVICTSSSEARVCVQLEQYQFDDGPPTTSCFSDLFQPHCVALSGGLRNEAQVEELFTMAATAALHLGKFYATMWQVWVGGVAIRLEPHD
jgi:hypothetical protein